MLRTNWTATFDKLQRIFFGSCIFHHEWGLLQNVLLMTILSVLLTLVLRVDDNKIIRLLIINNLPPWLLFIVAANIILMWVCWRIMIWICSSSESLRFFLFFLGTTSINHFQILWICDHGCYCWKPCGNP